MALPGGACRRAAAAPADGSADALQVSDLQRTMLDLIADSNVRSREEWVRCYDHEVQARSVVKPFVGRRRDGPSDGAVLLVRHDSTRGITVTHGICPRYGDHDAYHMAQCAVDEAVRAHVSLGGDPGRMAALDNFCWPDPVEGPGTPDGAYKLAQLVRACRGLAEACRAYRLPLISGKDSMKNDAQVGGRKISIRPTLLVSLLGIITDVRRAQTTDFKDPGDLIYVVGDTRGELGGTCLERRMGMRFGSCPSVRLPQAWAAVPHAAPVRSAGASRDRAMIFPMPASGRHSPRAVWAGTGEPAFPWTRCPSLVCRTGRRRACCSAKHPRVFS